MQFFRFSFHFISCYFIFWGENFNNRIQTFRTYFSQCGSYTSPFGSGLHATWENPDFSRRKGTRDFPSTSSPFVFRRKTPTRVTYHRERRLRKKKRLAFSCSKVINPSKISIICTGTSYKCTRWRRDINIEISSRKKLSGLIFSIFIFT